MKNFQPTGSYFDDESHFEEIEKATKLVCSFCEQDSRSPRQEFSQLGKLKAHLRNSHSLYMCEICLEGSEVFVSQQELYSKADLDKHYAGAELFTHMHETCPLLPERRSELGSTDPVPQVALKQGVQEGAFTARNGALAFNFKYRSFRKENPHRFSRKCTPAAATTIATAAATVATAKQGAEEPPAPKSAVAVVDGALQAADPTPAELAGRGSSATPLPHCPQARRWASATGGPSASQAASWKGGDFPQLLSAGAPEPVAAWPAAASTCATATMRPRRASTQRCNKLPRCRLNGGGGEELAAMLRDKAPSCVSKDRVSMRCGIKLNAISFHDYHYYNGRARLASFMIG
eukprot:gene5582-6769_t